MDMLMLVVLVLVVLVGRYMSRKLDHQYQPDNEQPAQSRNQS